MWSGVHSYRSTLDRLTYVNVEVWPLPMKIFWAKFTRAFTILGYTCMAVKYELFELYLGKVVCVMIVRDRVQNYELL